MISAIFKGWHYSLPFRPWLWWKRTHFAWVVKFDENCRYDLGNDDQYDTNKLVGIGYLPHHHKDSARFGWRYWTERKEIELSAYCYVNGRRIIQHIGFCQVGKWYRIELITTGMAYYFTLLQSGLGPIGDAVVNHNNKRRLQYRLGFYFGGNQKAPHKMTIQIEKS